VDIGILLGLLAAAVRAGLALPRALHAVGCAIGGTDGAALERVSAALLLGSSWTAAWAKAPGRLDVVSLALRPAWEHGAAPAQALGVAARQLRADRQSAASQAAARLGVRLVLPLGACFLPAFVLIGVVPLLISLGAGLLP
jgi:pilus assembly protein TadC